MSGQAIPEQHGNDREKHGVEWGDSKGSPHLPGEGGS